MPSPTWKQFERDLAAWVKHNAKRQSSRGVAEADVLSDVSTFECKSRKDVPAWLLEAFNQSQVNAKMYPGHTNFVALGAHFGRGNPIRVFLAKEVVLKADDYDKVSDEFKELLARLIPDLGEPEE